MIRVKKINCLSIFIFGDLKSSFNLWKCFSITFQQRLNIISKKHCFIGTIKKIYISLNAFFSNKFLLYFNKKAWWGQKVSDETPLTKNDRLKYLFCQQGASLVIANPEILALCFDPELFRLRLLPVATIQ